MVYSSLNFYMFCHDTRIYWFLSCISVLPHCSLPHMTQLDIYFSSLFNPYLVCCWLFCRVIHHYFAYIIHVCSIEVFLLFLSLIGPSLYYVNVTLYLSGMFVSLTLKFNGTC